MLLSYKEPLLILIAALNLIFDAFIAPKTPKTINKRTSFLWKFAVLGCTVFSIGLVALIIVLPQSTLNIFSWLVYDFLISYVACVEVPAYLRISKYDEKLVGILKDLRTDLTKMRFSFEMSLENLKEARIQNAEILREGNLDELLQDFITVCAQLKNLDNNLWTLTLNETSRLISEVAERSKHPFPKLIDILALSGLSVLLAQFLQLLG